MVWPERIELVRVTVTCLRCQHTAIVRVPERDDLAVTRISKRSVCSQCGSRAVKAQRRG